MPDPSTKAKMYFFVLEGFLKHFFPELRKRTMHHVQIWNHQWYQTRLKALQSESSQKILLITHQTQNTTKGIFKKLPSDSSDSIKHQLLFPSLAELPNEFKTPQPYVNSLGVPIHIYEDPKLGKKFTFRKHLF